MEILNGFALLFSNPSALAFVGLGALIGVLVGATPGLTSAAAIAMLMPLTYYLDPLSALAFLYVIGKSGRFGGSIAAILFNTPGTSASAATMRDGYPMTRQGKSGKALKVATVASVIGDTIGELVLIFGAATIAAYTIKFGPPEYFAVYAMAFIVIGSVVSESVVKGLLSALLGALVSLIGIDNISGVTRLTFGVYELGNGLSLVPLLIGIFVFSEVFAKAGATLGALAAVDVRPRSRDDSRFTLAEFWRCLPVMLRSSGIGAAIGTLPGLGSAVACFVAYGEERRRSKRPQDWGSGIPEGIAAPESANNAVSGPSMIPLLALGVPGSTIAAVLIGVFLVHGIQVGPSIFLVSGDLIFGLFAAGLTGIAVYGVVGFWGGPLIGRLITAVPQNVLYPFIYITAFAAAYSARQSLFDVGVALAFGVVGYAMRVYRFSAAAFIISFVLARGAEEAYRQSLLLSDSGNLIFLQRPISLAFLVIGFVTMAYRIYATFKGRPRGDSDSLRDTRSEQQS